MIAVVGLIAIGLKWTYYYDLNDDMLMQQILSGEYAGTPELRNIQNLVPFSALVSTLYRITSAVDWYALILLALLAVCYIMTAVRVLLRAGTQFLDQAAGDADAQTSARQIRRILQILGVVGVTVLYAALLLYHLVYVQYTIVVGVMGATAAFLILTSEDADNTRSFLRANIPSFVLIFVGYAIRSEMMMFMLPFAALAVLYRILPLRNIKEIALRIAASLLVLGIGVGAIYAIDMVAYSSPEWTEFRNLFDARTQLYDFESVPTYEGNEAFYDSIGLDASEVRLLENYNYSIDPDIDADVMQAVADYAAQLRKAEQSTGAALKEALWVYWFQKMFATSEMPYSMIAFVLYGLVLIAAVFEMISAVLDQKAASANEHATSQDDVAAENDCWSRILSALYMILEAGLLFAVRSGLWLYLLYSDRPVARLTHSMYYAEALLLLVILFYRRRLDITASFKAAFIACALLYAAGAQTTLTDNQVLTRENANAPYTAFVEYATEHSNAFYIVDVYSTVDFSKEMFDNNKVTANWTICGGWAAKSPLESKMLAAHNITSIEEGLVSGSSVYYVARAEYDTEWIVNYYEAQGIKVVVNRVDTIGDYWSVYIIDTWDL